MIESVFNMMMNPKIVIAAEASFVITNAIQVSTDEDLLNFLRIYSSNMVH